MKKGNTIGIIVVVVIVVVVGGFLLFHKSNKSNTSGNPTASTSQSSNAPAVNNAVLTTKTDSSLGQYLADPSGKPLYTYNADSKGVSNCTGSCLANWPPYVAKGSTSNLPQGVGVIKRSDSGQMQYTYNGLPLYYFVSDGSSPTGDGVENFSIAKPAASTSSSSSSSSSASNSTTPSSSTSTSTPSYNYPY